MLSININKDVEQYQESVLAGFNASQIIYLGLGGLAFGGSFALLHYTLSIPMMLCVYISIVPCAPFILMGFGAKNGMSFFERMKKMLGRKKEPLWFLSTELGSAYLRAESKMQNEKNEKREFDSSMKRTKKMLLIMGGLLILAVIAICVLKKMGKG